MQGLPAFITCKEIQILARTEANFNTVSIRIIASVIDVIHIHIYNADKTTERQTNKL